AAVSDRRLAVGLALGLLLMLQQPIVVDGHIDTPQRMLDMKTDITARLSDGHVDVPRMKEGGLTAAFFSIWVGARYGPGTAFRRGGGVSQLGRRGVRRMRALGVLVDVSDVSDRTFWDVMGTSTRPVIASRASCRALAHHPRNLSDDQLRAIAKNGGVVGINFYPVFLDEHFRQQYEELRRRLKPETDAIRARYRGHPGESAFEVDKFVGERAESLDVPTIDRLLDHIDHAVQVMGIDHVGLGSDFDG